MLYHCLVDRVPRNILVFLGCTNEGSYPSRVPDHHTSMHRWVPLHLGQLCKELFLLLWRWHDFLLLFHSPLGLSCGPWLWEIPPDMGTLVLAPCLCCYGLGKAIDPTPCPFPQSTGFYCC